LRLEQSELSHGVLALGTLEATESSLTDMRLQVDDALLAATGIFGGASELGSAVLVDAQLFGTRVDRCGSLRFNGSSVQQTFLASCDRTTAFEGGSIAGSRVLGALALAGTHVSGTRLVPGPGAALTFIDALVQASVFCGAEELIADGGGFRCDACAPEIASIMLGDVYVDSPECASLQAAAPE